MQVLSNPCDSLTGFVTAGSPSVVAGGFSGNGFNIPAGSGNTVSYNLPSVNQTDLISVGFRIKLTGANPSQQTWFTLRSDAGATSHVEMKWDSGGYISGYRQGSSGLGSISPAGTIPPDTWCLVECSCKLHDSTGTWRLYVNGALITTAPTVDTKNGGTKTVWDQVRFSGLTGTSQTGMVVDDIYIRDDGAIQSQAGGDARLARTSMRQLTSSPTPEARAARMSMRLLTRPASAPAAQVARVSARVLTALNVTEARTAQVGLRALVELEQPRSTVRIGAAPDDNDLAARTFREGTP